MTPLKNSLITEKRYSNNRNVPNRLIMAEITGWEGPSSGDAGGILMPTQQIRLSYYRDTTEGRRDWATMTTDERDNLVWMATHTILVDGTVCEVTHHDTLLLRDLGYL